ncbi:MAG: hypothetical protein R2825_03330 [Saprospiraceae bacterium]
MASCFRRQSALATFYSYSFNDSYLDCQLQVAALFKTVFLMRLAACSLMLAYERYGVAMGQMGGEIIFYGNVDEVNSIFETDAGGSPQISIVQPLPQQLNESPVTSNLEVEIDPDFQQLDSIFSV